MFISHICYSFSFIHSFTHSLTHSLLDFFHLYLLNLVLIANSLAVVGYATLGFTFLPPLIGNSNLVYFEYSLPHSLSSSLPLFLWEFSDLILFWFASLRDHVAWYSFLDDAFSHLALNRYFGLFFQKNIN
jgi:hypothetical protein